MEKLYSLHEASRILGVCTKTLQRWDKAGKIKVVRTPGGRRRIPESEVRRLTGDTELRTSPSRVLVIYARVSSHEQKAKGDLDRQVERVRSKFDLRLFDEIKVITDVSSGLNDRRKGLMRVMDLAREGKITDVAVSYRDRLTRFGFNYLRAYFESHGVKVHVVSGEEDRKTARQELVEDLLSIVTSFAGRLYGTRSKRKEEVIQRVREVISSAGDIPDAD
ncbi:DNA binding domain-containing protein, excisionase family [Thermanaeromonas toyohensis ToBE]|uniref:DNA binding domain-containing protein, excisionase family n=1 Tax=Thermanaeromonas toyohensis ToBE TaxID=698762 RepID=A0A1W1VUJ0_9FIRM|nr:IS607 family transposase [Thermanaeromonas toyohensis]SMB97052.1 DNA binding domain-containing protein, excisionase family [Thermanaeromonas toyohensis ToBE]